MTAFDALVAGLRAFPPAVLPDPFLPPAGWPQALLELLMSSEGPLLISNRVAIFPTYAELEAAQIDAAGEPVDRVYVLGRSEPFDGGAAAFRYSTGIETAGSVHSADGALWVRTDVDGIRPESLGAAADGVTPDDAALNEARLMAQETGAPIDLYGTYGMEELWLIDSADILVRGRGRQQVTLRALAPEAGIAVPARRWVTLRDIQFDGRHPTTQEVLATTAFRTLAPTVSLPAASGFGLEECIGRYTRGPAVIIDRDATEARIIGGIFGSSGRALEGQTGAARFPDGHVPAILWRGNGIMERLTASGATGFVVQVEGGPADGLGVFEEPFVRAFDCRIQNGFRGLLRVKDWLGEDDRAPATISDIPVVVHWFGGALENPGTVQDSTTSGGGGVTQTTSQEDDAYTLLADGAKARLALDGPVRIHSRHSTALGRAVRGAVIDADLKTCRLVAQERGVWWREKLVLEADGESQVRFGGLGEIWRGVADVYDSGDPRDYTQFAHCPPFLTRAPIAPLHARLLRSICDGLDAGAIADEPGYGATTWLGQTPAVQSIAATADADKSLASGSALRIVSDPAHQGPMIVRIPFDVEARWTGTDLMLEAQVAFERTAGWGGLDGDPELLLRVLDPAAVDASTGHYRDSGDAADNRTQTGDDAFWPVVQLQPRVDVPAPAAVGDLTGFYTLRAFLTPLKAGRGLAELRLDGRNQTRALTAWLGAVRLYDISGLGPGSDQ